MGYLLEVERLVSHRSSSPGEGWERNTHPLLPSVPGTKLVRRPAVSRDVPTEFLWMLGAGKERVTRRAGSKQYPWHPSAAGSIKSQHGSKELGRAEEGSQNGQETETYWHENKIPFKSLTSCPCLYSISSNLQGTCARQGTPSSWSNRAIPSHQSGQLLSKNRK